MNYKNKKPRLGLAFFVAKWFEEVVSGKDKTTKVFNKFITCKVIKKLKLTVD